jgi:hypothetical protein
MFGIEGLEVVVLVALVIVVLIIVVRSNYSLTEQLVKVKETQIETEKEKLKLAEKKYMQGKLKQGVFNQVKDDLKYKIILLELDIYRIKKTHTLEVEEKAQKLFAKLVHPTKHRRVSLRHMLIESEIVRRELKIIEKKLLKREIDESLFKRLISEKEDEMLEKENEIVHFIKRSSI